MVIVKKSVALVVSASLVLAGCATSSKDVASAYVSPIQYQNYDCGQIAAENQRLATRVSQLGGRLDEAASNDKAIMGVGLVLFWPALFALGGTKQQEAEYARLKGEHDALQQAAIAKNCSILTAKNESPATTSPVAPVPNTTATAGADTHSSVVKPEQP
jgi:outer membrane murein-binding lipoprotein Lpp